MYHLRVLDGSCIALKNGGKLSQKTEALSSPVCNKPALDRLSDKKQMHKCFVAYGCKFNMVYAVRIQKTYTQKDHT